MRIGKSCPECDKGITVKRTNKIDSSHFIGCNQFPRCRYTCSFAKSKPKSNSRYKHKGEKINKGGGWYANADKDELLEVGEWNPSVYEM